MKPNPKPTKTTQTFPDWWETGNSIAIWASVFAIFGLIIGLSIFQHSFGQNQLIMLGFITLLLLFKYIRKIKLGDIIDIEFKNLEDHLNNLKVKATTLESNLTAGKALTAPDATAIVQELILAQGNLENIKERALGN